MGLTIDLGAPRHGWLPVRWSCGGDETEVAASAVLNDPVAECIDLLRLVASPNPGTQRVCLWLEPAAWVFEFTVVRDPATLGSPVAPSRFAGERVAVAGTREEHLAPPFAGRPLAMIPRGEWDRRRFYRVLRSTLTRFLDEHGGLLSEHWRATSEAYRVGLEDARRRWRERPP